MPRVSVKKVEKVEEEVVDEEEEEETSLSKDEIVEVGSLVDKTLSKFNTSKHVIHPKAFNKLTERLMGSAKSQAPSSSSSASKTSTQEKSTSALDIKQKLSHLYSSSAEADALKKAKAPPNKADLGKGWFNMETVKLDDKLKRDLKVIQMRNYLDPKRFYKNPDKPGKILHVGTVVEGPSEYKSARMTKKERKQSLVEEILSDSTIKNYTKRKFSEIQEKNSKKRGNLNKVKKGRMGQNKSAKKLRMLY